MVKEKPYFNKYERLILSLLVRQRRPMSTKEISEEMGISWVTARKWLRSLKEKGFVKEYGTKWKKRKKRSSE